VPVLRIDHVSIKGKLLGVWQAFYSGGVLDFKEMTRRLIRSSESFDQGDQAMQNIKFVVKVNRCGTRAPEYIQRC
jgi:hypothetical protein